jgi:hypothetical protein
MNIPNLGGSREQGFHIPDYRMASVIIIRKISSLPSSFVPIIVPTIKIDVLLDIGIVTMLLL